MTNAVAGAVLDEIMQAEAENNPGCFSTAKGTLRFYLQERKKFIDSGQEIDWSTAQGIWYLVEPYVPKNSKGEYIDRDTFVSYIRVICKKDLHCRREDLRIVAGGRAELYFNGEWTTISWDSIEELSKSGTDGILMEKEGMSRIYEPFVDAYGIAVINTRGFFVDYLGDVSTKSIDEKSNLVLIRDFDPSGIIIELGAKSLEIPCIGVNDEMLDYFGLTRKDVQDRHIPSGKNNHWKKIKNIAKTNPEIRKEIEFLSKYRIEIDKVHAKVGSRRMFEYALHKLAEYNRDLNRVIAPQDYVQPEILGLLAFHMHRIGEKAGKPEADRIYLEQCDYEGFCDNIEERQKDNDFRVRRKIESNENIKSAIGKLKPIVDELKNIIIEDDDDDEEDSDSDQ
jgi:hypothetical protein